MTCEHADCENKATVAIRTQRPTRANLWTKIWWTESEGPKNAQRFCGDCAHDTLSSLAKFLG